MKKPEMLVLIAAWQFITAFFSLVGIAAIAIWGFVGIYRYEAWGPGVTAYSTDFPVWFVFGMSIAILVLVCYMVLGLVGGIGLLKGREWGRMTSIVHNALSLVNVPIGTVIGTMAIVYLTKQEVKDYFTAAKSGDVPPGSVTPQ